MLLTALFIGSLILSIATNNNELKLNTPLKITFDPNTKDPYTSFVPNDYQLKKTALLSAVYPFTAPSTGTFRFTFRNANVLNECDVNMFIYSTSHIPTPTSYWGNYLLASSTNNFSDPNETADVDLNSGDKIVVIAYPYYVRKRPQDLSVLVEDITD
jgi:hypothetical protein